MFKPPILFPSTMKPLTLIPRTLISSYRFHSLVAEESHRRRTEPLRRNYDEENRAVKVTVWWDFENCSVPSSVNVERVAGRILSATRSAGIKGPVTVTAFGDVSQLSRAAHEALTSTGVRLNHVPQRGKNSSDRSFMADLVYWVTQNPPPAHFFLISSDKDFANILHRLRMSNYNILLSSRNCAAVLSSAATVMWPWYELVKGENVTAKHFSHPPDGFYGSWYGQYKGTLDDPFTNNEQCKSEEPIDPVSETKVQTVPKAVVNAISKVLHSNPEGMSISELRAELKRKNVHMDKDLYGYKKFSNLLSSLPSIVKFIPNSLGQPLVSDKRAEESTEYCSKCAAKQMEKSNKPYKVPTKPSTESDKPSEITSSSVATTNYSQQIKDAAVDGDLMGSKESTSELPVSSVQNSEVKEGLLRRIWASLTGARRDRSSY